MNRLKFGDTTTKTKNNIARFLFFIGFLLRYNINLPYLQKQRFLSLYHEISQIETIL